MRLVELAEQLAISVPQDLKRNKGWQGQLLETALDATALTKSEPDFEHLGIELKTLPIDAQGKPRESTFVCTASLSKVELTWRTSHVYRKLAHVLWCPILIDRGMTIAERQL